MGESSIWDNVKGRLQLIPIRIAYRIVWMSAKLGSPVAKGIYEAMWEANLDLPKLGKYESNSE